MEEESATISKSLQKRSSPGLSGMMENFKTVSPTLSSQFNMKSPQKPSPISTLAHSPDHRSIDTSMPILKSSTGYSDQNDQVGSKDKLKVNHVLNLPKNKSSSILGITKDPRVSKMMENVQIASPPSRTQSKSMSPNKSITSPGSPTKKSLDISLPSVKSLESSSLKNDLLKNIKIIKENEKFSSSFAKPTQDASLESFSKIEPKGKVVADQVDELNESLKELSKNLQASQSPALQNSIKKISVMSKTLTNEAQALRKSLKTLSRDNTIQEQKEDVHFPYHLFLIELIINSINMKCECFEVDCINLVMTAEFLGKPPIVLYDNSSEEDDDLKHLNMGKSAIFAMTYDKICSIQDLTVKIQMTKQPPCSDCVMKIAEANLDFTKEFLKLRKELIKKMSDEQQSDDVSSTASMPLKRSMHYLKHSGDDHCEPIGVIEVSARMSFLGKEITSTFCASPKHKGASSPKMSDDGVSLCTCQDVEMDVQGNVFLNEDVLVKKKCYKDTKAGNPNSISNVRTAARVNRDDTPRCNEIFTKMNENELIIRIPKTNHFERTAKYDKIQELCECESTSYNTGDQIQFKLPKDLQGKDTQYTSDIKFNYNAYDNSKDKKIVNVTPTNCPVPVDMRKLVHPLKDVFILKVGKKLETPDKKTELEIELVTPKGPTKATENVSQQCSSSLLTGSSGLKTIKKSDRGKKSKLKLSKKSSKSKNVGKHSIAKRKNKYNN